MRNAWLSRDVAHAFDAEHEVADYEPNDRTAW
jgi:hypothetical protein